MTQKFVTCQKLISKGRFKQSTLIPVTKSCRNTHRKLERTTLQVKIVSIGQFLSTRTTKMWRIFEKRVFEVGPISNMKVPRDIQLFSPAANIYGGCLLCDKISPKKLPPVQHCPLQPLLQIQRPVDGIPPFGHPLLHVWQCVSGYGQEPPQLAPLVTCRRWTCVPLPQVTGHEGFCGYQALTAQFVTGHRRLRRLLQPSDWSNITNRKTRKDQNDVDMITQILLSQKIMKKKLNNCKGSFKFFAALPISFEYWGKRWREVRVFGSRLYMLPLNLVSVNHIQDHVCEHLFISTNLL